MRLYCSKTGKAVYSVYYKGVPNLCHVDFSLLRDTLKNGHVTRIPDNLYRCKIRECTMYNTKGILSPELR